MSNMVQTPIIIDQPTLDAVDRITEPRGRAEWIRQAIREKLARVGVEVAEDDDDDADSP